MSSLRLGRFVARRLAYAFLLMLLAIFTNFLIINAVPGDPVTAFVGQEGAPPEYVQMLRHKWGLDQPILDRLAIYYISVFQGDLGYSLPRGQPALAVIIERVPATVQLMITSLILASVIGISLGVTSSKRKPHSFVDNTISVIAVSGYSLPVFWFGMILMMIFGLYLKVLPIGGMVSLRTPPTGIGYVIDVAKHMILPVTALVFMEMALITRLTRQSMQEEISKDYITTARSKGLPQNTVYYKHALRNAVLPVMTVVGMELGYLLTGSVLIESVFGWPGMGSLAFEAILQRDYPVLMGILIFSTLMAVVANLVTDIVYAIIDPRIRYT